MLGRTDTRTRERMYCQTIRTVRDISRDDRARIATCSLRTPTDRVKENYSIDVVMSSFSRLFVTRLFSGPIVVQSMLLNRRFDDAEVKVSLTGEQNMADTFTLATITTGPEVIPPEKKKRDATTPIIYACATMWHENKLVRLVPFWIVHCSI